MNRVSALLFSLLMVSMLFAGCIGGEDVDTSLYEQKITDLEDMLDEKNQTISEREASIDALEDGLFDATQMIQDYEEEILIIETYRDSLLFQLENSNNSSLELTSQLESANLLLPLT